MKHLNEKKRLCMIIRLRIIILIELLIIIFALPIEARFTEQEIKFDLDFAQFRMDEKSVYLEVYYSILRQEISHQPTNEGFWGAFQIKTRLLKNDSLVASDSLSIEDRVDSLEQISPGQKFTEVSKFVVNKGDYLIKTTFTDLVNLKFAARVDSIQVTPFSHKKLTLSSIELASSIRIHKDRQNKFYKNGLRVIPNSDLIYGKALPRLYFYAEAYNFAWDGDAKDSTYQVCYKISDMNGVTVFNIKGKKKKKPGKTCVVYGALDIGELASGAYRLEVKVVDFYNQWSAISNKSFFVYKKSDYIKKPLEAKTQIAFVDSEKYKQMREEQLNTYFEQIKYITTKEEKKVFKELNLSGKRNFFINFWAGKDPDPTTPRNEREFQYNQLIKIANEHFTMAFKKGWKTDRGRILLVYGLPNTKEIFPATIETKAYEVWHYYNIESGVIFVFVDRRRTGEYELVHSTKRGEISDPDWLERYALQYHR